jgi:hypothetical protein
MTRFEHSPAALDRARGTIHACQLLHQHAGEIAHVCGETGPGNIVVVSVEPRHMILGGIWTVPRAEIARRVPELENGGWAFTFSSGASAAHIQDRALRTARLAFARWLAMQRRTGGQR